MDELTGKCALMTGGTRGIGRAIAIAPATDVAFSYHSSEARAESLVHGHEARRILHGSALR